MTTLRQESKAWPWFANDAAMRVLTVLNADGEEARVVGGAVRNALLGLDVGEIDIATTALPNEVMRRAGQAHIKAVPTGVAHGTVTLIVDSAPFEITTLREDVETDGRHAKVAFGRDWSRDAQRRDFTINGLSVSMDGAVHDHTSGLDDIAAKRVRFIGDANKRIAEDYLRILRFFRMHAYYGDGAPVRDGLLACIRGRNGLARLSAERVRAEMLKLLVAPRAADAVQSMTDGGLLLALFGGVAYPATFARMIDVEAQMQLAPDAIRRLGALGIAIAEDAERLATRLRLTNAEALRLDSMAHRWWRFADLDEELAKRRLYRIGAARYVDRALLAWARTGNSLKKIASLPQRWTAPAFPLKAADFIVRGIAPGPTLGRALADAEDAWIEAGFPGDAHHIADEIAGQASGPK